jgi:growth hormone-inducible transmembrane protein
MATGLGVVAVTAIGLHKSGFSYRIALRMQSNPFLTMGASLVGVIGTMMLVQSIPPQNTGSKRVLSFESYA